MDTPCVEVICSWFRNSGCFAELIQACLRHAVHWFAANIGLQFVLEALCRAFYEEKVLRESKLHLEP